MGRVKGALFNADRAVAIVAPHLSAHDRDLLADAILTLSTDCLDMPAIGEDDIDRIYDLCLETGAHNE